MNESKPQTEETPQVVGDPEKSANPALVEAANEALRLQEPIKVTVSEADTAPATDVAEVALVKKDLESEPGSVVARASASLASGSEPTPGAKPTPPDAVAVPEEPETFLYASNQAEMSKAQTQLVAWAEKKMASLRKELKDAKTNLRLAAERKWKKSTFQTIVDKLEKKVTFYEKVEAALKAGYTIIPDMDVDLFAIRTTRKNAKQNRITGKWTRPTDQKSNTPPLGEGRYVTPEGEHSSKSFVAKHEPGKDPQWETVHWTDSHDEHLDFPFKMARPAVLNATQQALSAKMFDEVGVLPRFRKQPDPVIVGRITLREGYHEKRFNFLICWYIDTKEL